jgi:hypothetical protein
VPAGLACDFPRAVGWLLAARRPPEEVSPMRTLILLGLVVGGLVVAGAIHISQSNGTIEVSIDKQKVKNVAGAVAREGEQLLRNAANQNDSQKR